MNVTDISLPVLWAVLGRESELAGGALPTEASVVSVKTLDSFRVLVIGNRNPYESITEQRWLSALLFVGPLFFDVMVERNSRV